MKLKSLPDLIKESDDRRYSDALAIVEMIQTAGGKAYIVGGYVRDAILGQADAKDIDLEVYGLELSRLKDALQKLGKVDLVGASFQVFKLRDIDVAIPRTEVKTGARHQDFDVTGDPGLSIKEAVQRRDLTINALLMDPLTGEVIDEVGGLDNLKNKQLRAVNLKTFAEDSLRVLRLMQFAARFGFEIESKTFDLASKLDLSTLPAERVGDEWWKLLMKSHKPSIGLEAGRRLGVIKKLHPELESMIGTEQEPEWHPEGDVWKHTLIVVDAAAKLASDEALNDDEKWILMLGALTHDIGKPMTTSFNPKRKRITSYNHDRVGQDIAKDFLAQLAVSHRVAEKVSKLVREHMFTTMAKDPTPAAVRRLAKRLQPATIQELVWLITADKRGRGDNSLQAPEAHKLFKMAEELRVEEEPEPPLVRGRDLLKLGIEPGPSMGEVLNELYEAQMDGKFSSLDDGLDYFKSSLAKSRDFNV